MRKINLFSVLMAIFAIALSVSFTSCKDDNDSIDDLEDSSNIKVTYSVDLADTWYQFFNVEMTYTNPGGMTETEIIDMDQENSMTLPFSMIPNRVIMKVIARPKTNHPEVVDGIAYPMGHSLNLQVVKLKEDGNGVDEILFSAISNTSYNLGGDSFIKALEQEHILYDKSYTIKD